LVLQAVLARVGCGNNPGAGRQRLTYNRPHEWRDQGIILAVRLHGETSAIVEVLTREQGRHAGLVRGGRSRSMRPILQPGNQITVNWRARLSEHLGMFQIEADDLTAGLVMEDRTALAGLKAACAIAVMSPPEGEGHPQGPCRLSSPAERIRQFAR
jgi:DNA repair protein RecO (recombination protein O)